VRSPWRVAENAHRAWRPGGPLRISYIYKGTLHPISTRASSLCLGKCTVLRACACGPARVRLVRGDAALVPTRHSLADEPIEQSRLIGLCPCGQSVPPWVPRDANRRRNGVRLRPPGMASSVCRHTHKTCPRAAAFPHFLPRREAMVQPKHARLPTDCDLSTDMPYQPGG
jgi:hypothetical protein